jgi:hypothetical protein
MSREAGAVHFESDLFISYAHIDDQPLSPEQLGWISRFHASLEALLSMRLGRKARIWRDPKLQGNDVFGDEIIDQFSNTAVLVSVITPRYLNSDWCTKEIREFCAQAEKSGGVVLENRARVFKVLKTPVVTQDPLPAVVKDLLGYEFFRVEGDTPLELDPAYGETFGQDYNRKIGQLAWDVKELVEDLVTTAAAGDEAAEAKTATKPVVYLAECSYDRKQNRETLEGELRRLGYAVLPDRELPRDEAGYVDAVERLLSDCRLAVHLIGASQGAVPDGPSEKSIVELQNEVAVGRSKTAALPRVIWLPDGTTSEQPAQQAFLEALQTDPAAQLGADLITGDFEALRTTLYVTLTRLEEGAPADVGANGVEVTPGLVYLICTARDRHSTVSVRKYLHDHGLVVSMPAFEGDAAAIRAVHEQLLTECETVLLFYGAGDEAWKRAMDNELRKLSAYREGRPLRASFTYLAEPSTDDKEDLIGMGEPHLIDGRSASAEAELSAFMEALSSGDATR